jgi:hypothetical protein
LPLMPDWAVKLPATGSSSAVPSVINPAVPVPVGKQ